MFVKGKIFIQKLSTSTVTEQYVSARSDIQLLEQMIGCGNRQVNKTMMKAKATAILSKLEINITE